MDYILETLFYSQLKQCGFYLNKNAQITDHFYSFKLNHQIGNGFYDVIAVENKFAIVTKKFSFHDDAHIMWSQPEYLCVENTNRNLNVLWNKEYSYKFILPSQSIVSGTSITIMPEYFKMLLDYFPQITNQALTDLICNVSSSPTFLPVFNILEQLKTLPIKGRSSSLYYDGKIRELLALLIYRYDLQNTNFEIGAISNSDKEALSYLILKIEETLYKPMSISECTKITCMGKSKLSVLFHQLYGKTISEYYQYLRIQKAKELLIYSDIDVTQISHSVGYKTPAAFSSLFKSVCGQTPSKYRKIMRHE